VASIEPLPAWLDARSGEDGAAVMLTPDADASLAAMLRHGPPRAMLIGPEGGFTPEELAHAARRDVRRAHLGPRALRAETAALAALAAVEVIAS
jgi:16S rRNA (uracil1498-N3)-methyltransferase